MRLPRGAATRCHQKVWVLHCWHDLVGSLFQRRGLCLVRAAAAAAVAAEAAATAAAAAAATAAAAPSAHALR